MPNLLAEIQKENDIKQIRSADYKRLATEIRKFLIDNVSKTGGHLASNLGVVELTIALHLSLEFPEDKLIWDVGHQAYVHKILTGRKDLFTTLRKQDGLSGFPKRKESNCDAFDTGHSSTSLSAALGIAKARDLAKKNNKVVAVIGDGALTGGMAYEALNNMGRLKSNLIVVLNDNNMSISENVGGMANYLAKLRTNSKYTGMKAGIEKALSKVPVIGSVLVDKLKKSKDSIKHLMIPGMFFEDMGLTYIGPIDGHDITKMVTALQTASKAKKAVIVHVITQKGKGYQLAEKNPSKYHGVDPFNIKSGESTKGKKQSQSYTQVFSEKIVSLAKEDEKIVAITAAMPTGTGLVKFANTFPERFFDVGIAEEHAVTFAAGLAAEGYKPIVAIYSTFLQRAYDQILHDVCISSLPVVFMIDRGGIVGSDGETHQGIYDLSFLSSIPNLTVMAPKNAEELRQMLAYAINVSSPVAIRYPRGAAYEELAEVQQPLHYGKSEIIKMQQEIALVAVGSMVETAVKVESILREKMIPASIVNARFVSPIDTHMLDSLCENHKLVVVMEENVKRGGYGEAVSAYYMESHAKVQVLNISIPNVFVPHGDPDSLKRMLELDAEHVAERVMTAFQEIEKK